MPRSDRSTGSRGVKVLVGADLAEQPGPLRDLQAGGVGTFTI